MQKAYDKQNKISIKTRCLIHEPAFLDDGNSHFQSALGPITGDFKRIDSDPRTDWATHFIESCALIAKLLLTFASDST